MNHLEIEFKTMLTKEEHDRLLQLFPLLARPTTTSSQINRVSDTPTWLFEYELLNITKQS